MIAGAGSGKTTVMAARVVWLVATGQVAPAEVLGLTFTTKAAAELGDPASAARSAQAGLAAAAAATHEASDEVEEPTVSTYHAYAAGLLTEHGLRIGHEPDTRLIADASRYQLAARAIQRYRRARAPPHRVARPRGPLPARARRRDDRAPGRPRRRTPRRREHREQFVAGMEGETRTTYLAENQKASRRSTPGPTCSAWSRPTAGSSATSGWSTSPTRSRSPRTLARDRPEVGALEREKYRVVLLDEYQDTSVAQAIDARPAVLRRPVEQGRGHPVTAVGDPNQAIYGWRGASVSNILEFGRSFPTAARHPGDVPAHRQPPLRRPHPGDRQPPRTAAVRRAPELLPLEPKPEAPHGEVRAAVHETWDGELDALADDVIACHAAGVPWKEVGVLTRDNTHAAAVFDALTDREVPVEIVGLKGLLRLPEVAEVVATLALIQDVTDNAALLTLLTGPRWAVGLRDLALLGRRARELAGPQGRGRTFPDVRAELAAAVEGSDPTEIASLGDALDQPGRPPVLARGPRALRPAVGRAAPAPVVGGRADPRPGAPHRRHHGHRRRARLVGEPGGRQRAATTSTSSCRPSPSSRRSTGRSR